MRPPGDGLSFRARCARPSHTKFGVRAPGNLPQRGDSAPSGCDSQVAFQLPSRIAITALAAPEKLPLPSGISQKLSGFAHVELQLVAQLKLGSTKVLDLALSRKCRTRGVPFERFDLRPRGIQEELRPGTGDERRRLSESEQRVLIVEPSSVTVFPALVLQHGQDVLGPEVKGTAIIVPAKLAAQHFQGPDAESENALDPTPLAGSLPRREGEIISAPLVEGGINLWIPYPEAAQVSPQVPHRSELPIGLNQLGGKQGRFLGSFPAMQGESAQADFQTARIERKILPFDPRPGGLLQGGDEPRPNHLLKPGRPQEQSSA